MAHVTDPLWIHVASRRQNVHAALHVDNFLEKLRGVPFIERVLDGHVSRTRYRMIRQQRDQSALGQRDSFIKKLFAISHRRVLPAPVSPNNRRERTAAFRHDQIGGDDSALGTIVSDVVNRGGRASLHADSLKVERRVSIVVEVAGGIGLFSGSNQKTNRG